jgi:hypothetical protein
MSGLNEKNNAAQPQGNETMKQILSVVAVVVAMGVTSVARADSVQDQLTAKAWTMVKASNGQLHGLMMNFDKTGGFTYTERDINGQIVGSVSGTYELSAGVLKLYVNGKLALTTSITIDGDKMTSTGGGKTEVWERVR